MRVDIRNIPQQIALYLTLFLVVIYAGHQIFVDSTQIIDGRYGIASKQLYLLFSDIFPILNKFSIVVYVIGGVLLTRLSIIKSTYTPTNISTLILYLIFSTMFFQTQNNIIEATTSLIVILSLYRLLKSFNYVNTNLHYVFTAGILMGLTPLLTPQAVFILPIIVVACLRFKRSPNEIVIYSFGYIFPFTIYSYVLWALNYPYDLIFDNIYSACSEWNYSYLMEAIMQAGRTDDSAVYFFVTIFISIVSIVIYNIKNSTQQQVPIKHMFILFCYFGLLMSPTLLIASNPTALVSVAAIPLAILISSLFIRFSNLFILMLYIYVLFALFVF